MKRERVLQVRLSEEEYLSLVGRAEGMPVSMYVRRVVLGGQVKSAGRTSVPKRSVPEAVAEVMEELGQKISTKAKAVPDKPMSAVDFMRWKRENG